MTNVPAPESSSQCFFPLIKGLNRHSFYAADLQLLQAQVASGEKERQPCYQESTEESGSELEEFFTNSLSSSFSSSLFQPALFMLPKHCKQVEMLSVCATPLVLHAHLFLHAPSLYCFSKASKAEEVKPCIKPQVTCEPQRGADFNPISKNLSWNTLISL